MNINILGKAMWSGLLLLAAVSAADAARREQARVVDVDAVTDRRYQTEEVCWERGSRRRDDGKGGAIAGALIGGLLGNQVGGGDGRRAATIAGAVAGAIAGRNLDRRERDRYQCEERQVYFDDVHYDVRYSYRGRIYRTRLNYDPGRWLTVRVSERRGRIRVEPIS